MVLACLLHDASECYMSDVPSPFKKTLPEYQEQEAYLLHLIYEKFLGSDLTAQEHAVYKRGRNAKSFTMAKHATMADYRTATGFEALVGWLFLEERFERLTQLVSTGLERIGALEMKTGSPEQKGES